MKPNDVLDGRYKLGRRVGVGGMGSVWEARELPSDRHVAIKALHEHLINETELVTRFLREAQAALEARYSGHIIEVYDVVQPAERPPYIVMEFLEGEDLEQILEREGPLEPRRAVDLIIQTCEAVAEVHRQGFIHRDIKPENLFLTQLQDGTEWIKLLDFGVVKFSDTQTSQSRPLTEHGRTVGTVWYMAPEQASDPATIDHRVDIYATGVVLYELLTGEVPFDSEDQRELMRLLYKGSPTPIREHRPGLSEALEKVVMRAMSVSRRKRFQTIYELAEALEPLSSSGKIPGQRTSEIVSVPGASAPGLLASILSRRASETIEIHHRPARRLPRRFLIVAGVAALACVIVGFGIWFFSASTCPATTTAPQEVSAKPILSTAVDGGTRDGGDDSGAREAGALDDQEAQRRWANRYGKRLNKRAVARGLRKLSPGIRRCLKGTRAPGTRVLMHFWIASDGTVQYRRSRPSLSRASEGCIRRVTRAKRLSPTKVPPFVATQSYIVPQ